MPLERPIVSPLVGSANKAVNDTLTDPELTLHLPLISDMRDVVSGRNLFTLTRASNAAYFDKDGVLRTATSNEARFDHDPATGESLGLLVEESRTNQVLDSIDLSTANWNTLFLSVSSDQETFVDGTTLADKIVEDNTSNSRNLSHANFSVDPKAAVSASVFYKASGRRYASLYVHEVGAINNAIEAVFDLQNGTVITQNRGTGSGVSATIKAVGSGGWYYCTISGVPSTTGTQTLLRLYLNDASDFTYTYTGDGSSGVFAGGVQLEANAFPTSYIPTAGSTVTRSADQPVTTTLDWLDAAATAVGTWVVVGSFQYGSASPNRSALVLDDGGITDRFYINLDAAEQIDFNTVNSADTNGTVNGSTPVAVNTKFKYAAAYADDDLSAALDGSLETPDTTAGIPLTDNPTTLRIGHSTAGNYWNGHIAEIRYYNTRKTNTFLQSITT